MKKVREALEDRQSDIFSVSAMQTVHSAAEYMTEKNIGAVAVLEGRQLLGVLSERDILNRIVTEDVNPHTTVVGEVMSMDVVTASPDDDCEECVVRMKGAHCRHLPVIDKGRFLGMISLRDLLGIDLEAKTEKVELLDQFIWNRP